MTQRSILIMLHCEQNTGYAIGPLEKVFEESAKSAGYDNNSILWSYTTVHTPESRIFELGYYTPADSAKLSEIHAMHNIETILAFDMPYPTAVGREAHRLGIKNIVSYWGASMSSINTGMKRLVKRLEWMVRRSSAPTQFIFESDAMKQTATLGRGAPESRTCVIPLGVDTETYFPSDEFHYAHKEFDIPRERKILFFSGHMEERKGVRVLVEMMNNLHDMKRLEPFHLLICGNKGDESLPYEALIRHPETKKHITFAGYRNDIPQLMRSSFLGAIASTGWDSFTMSSVEMLASGLPIIVSELQGLKETIDAGVCGEYIKPGNATQLAQHVLTYLDDPDRYNQHRAAARNRALTRFSRSTQIERIARTLLNDSSRKHLTSSSRPENHGIPEGPQ